MSWRRLMVLINNLSAESVFILYVDKHHKDNERISPQALVRGMLGG